LIHGAIVLPLLLSFLHTVKSFIVSDETQHAENTRKRGKT